MTEESCARAGILTASRATVMLEAASAKLEAP
jgi:hypothetical protein